MRRRSFRKVLTANSDKELGWPELAPIPHPEPGPEGAKRSADHTAGARAEHRLRAARS